MSADSETVIGAVSTIVVAIIAASGAWVSTRSSRTVSHAQQLGFARQLDRQAFESTISEVRKTQNDMSHRMDDQERETAKLRSLLLISIRHIREIRLVLRTNQLHAPEIPNELMDVWLGLFDDTDQT